MSSPQRPWKTLEGGRPRIIAHRGASGYRPEHTLEGYALAFEQGADVIEPDLVATRDGVLYARHEPVLARSTDVASRAAFAGHARRVGARRDWWIGDFSAVQVDMLRARQPVAARGTGFDGRFGVPRFAQVLDLARHAAARCGRRVVVDAEIKEPASFGAIGIDVVEALLRDLAPRALTGPRAPVWLECFDHAFLREAHRRCGNPCFALVERLPRRAAAREALLRGLATWARGIAAAKRLLWNRRGADSGLADAAHARGLEIHAWTFRDDASPAPFASARDELFAAFALGVDALFCDFPDTAVRARAEFESAMSASSST